MDRRQPLTSGHPVWLSISLVPRLCSQPPKSGPAPALEMCPVRLARALPEASRVPLFSLPADRSWPGPQRLAPVAAPTDGSPAAGTAGADSSAATTGVANTRRIRPRPSLVLGHFLDTVVVTLHGDLDLPASVQLAGVLRDLIEGQDSVAVVVDVGDVVRICGSGVDVLASAGRRMQERGGHLRVARASRPTADALASAGLARLLSARAEQAPRGWTPSPRASAASRQAGIRAHPAVGRYEPGGCP